MRPFSHENKTQALTRHLAAMALEMEDGAKFPTVTQLAASLGVSIMTLNRALSELEARGLIVRRHAVGIFVTRQVSQRTIALVCAQDLGNMALSPFWSMLLDSLRERVLAHNERIRFYMAQAVPGAQNPPQDLVEDVEASRVQAVLVIGPHEPLYKLLQNWAQSQGLPVVTFGGSHHVPAHIQLDPVAAINLAIPELKRRGCTRIGIWSSYEFLVHEPFRQALAREDLPYSPSLCRFPTGEQGHSQDTGQTLALEVFGPQACQPGPEGLLIMDDMVTRGALTALHRLGLHAGRHVQIATHANKNSSVLHGYEDCLVRVEFAPGEIAELMLQLLDDQLAGQAVTAPLFVRPHLVLPATAPSNRCR